MTHQHTFLPTAIIVLVALTSACTSPSKKDFDLAKLQPNERVYAGNIQVNLNGKTNTDLTCDLFLNSDIAPVFRLSPSGDYVFKSNRKTLAFSKIVCIHKVDTTSVWAKQNLNLKRIERPEDASAIHKLDNLAITWTIADQEIKKDSTNPFETSRVDKVIGKIEVKSLPYLETHDPQ